MLQGRLQARTHTHTHKHTHTDYGVGMDRFRAAGMRECVFSETNQTIRSSYSAIRADLQLPSCSHPLSISPSLHLSISLSLSLLSLSYFLPPSHPLSFFSFPYSLSPPHSSFPFSLHFFLKISSPPSSVHRPCSRCPWRTPCYARDA